MRGDLLFFKTLHFYRAHSQAGLSEHDLRKTPKHKINQRSKCSGCSRGPMRLEVTSLAGGLGRSSPSDDLLPVNANSTSPLGGFPIFEPSSVPVVVTISWKPVPG